jgi:hypothetical protein
VTVDVLPDVVLLEIFSFYVDDAWMEAWHTLVHVCRKWRSVVFGSQRRLNLRLRCTAGTQVRETLGIWPLLPIDIKVFGHEMWGKWGADNILAALESNDRICRIDLFYIPNLELEKILAAMQQPFSALTRLRLQSRDYTAPAIPASFLGGSAPHLQSLILDRIPFPELPKLLLTSTHLVSLRLWEIPDSGYISPEAMVTCLSMLTRLERLDIGFESPRCYPDRKSRRPPPQTRTLLPALTTLRFRGVGKYLEDIVARIDSPLLDDLVITFFHQLILDTPQLTQFITRTPKFKAHDEARVYFSNCGVWVTLPQAFDGVLNVGISCGQSDWQLSSLAQICSSIFPHAFIPVLEHLYILEERFSRLCWQDDIEASQWLDLLRPFIAVKSLYVSREFAPHIAPALQELVEELPALQTLFLEEPFPSGPVQETIEHFVAARQVDSHPIAVSCWERK